MQLEYQLFAIAIDIIYAYYSLISINYKFNYISNSRQKGNTKSSGSESRKQFVENRTQVFFVRSLKFRVGPLKAYAYLLFTAHSRIYVTLLVGMNEKKKQKRNIEIEYKSAIYWSEFGVKNYSQKLNI